MNMTDAKQSESIVSLVLRTFFALPAFLIISVIFWELVLGAWLLSGWLYEKGWRVLGLSAKVVGILLAALIIFATAKFFVGWILLIVRRIRGDKT
jgi:hypothetical protein